MRKMIFALVFLSAHFTFAGTVDGGGGNVLHSTPDQVARYLKKATLSHFGGEEKVYGFASDFEDLLRETYTLQHGGALLPIPPKVQEIIMRLSAKERLLLFEAQSRNRFSKSRTTEFDPTPFGIEVKSSGPCRHGNEDRDASFDSQTGKICLSLQRLARYPDSLLAKTILPLVIHEMAHEAGFGESDAILVQNYFQKKAETPKCRISMSGIIIEIADAQHVDFTMPGTTEVFSQISKDYPDNPLSGFVPLFKWFVYRFVPVKDEPSSNLKAGEISDRDKFSIQWNPDRSGRISFKGLNVSREGKASVTDLVLVWNAPKRTQNPAEGYVADLIQGTNYLTYGVHVSQEKDALSFSDSCF